MPVSIVVSGRKSSAARAALDLTGTKTAVANPYRRKRKRKRNPAPYPRISATTAAKACAGSAAWLIGRPITK
ncbi:hypothetical protein PAGU2196_30920 [Pseudomonas sp. PAGU 2196]|nr:hypothetical protein PAGU2196_30920 [Pseudomonas sp. PAGU 2196]